MLNRILIPVLLLALLFAGSGWFRSCQNHDLTKEQNAALNGQLTKTVDKLGRANFAVGSFEGKYNDLLAADARKDTTLKRLQALLAEAGKRAAVRSAVSFDATTRGRAVGQTGVFAANTQDTIRVFYTLPDSVKIVAAVSSKRFDPTRPPTFVGVVTATRDSVTVDPYVVQVGFDVVQTETKGTITTTIRPTDPNITVTSAKSFTKELPKKNRGLWAGVGAAVVIVLSLLLP